MEINVLEINVIFRRRWPLVAVLCSSKIQALSQDIKLTKAPFLYHLTIRIKFKKKIFLFYLIIVNAQKFYLFFSFFSFFLFFFFCIFLLLELQRFDFFKLALQRKISNTGNWYSISNISLIICIEDNLIYFQYFFNNIIEDNLRYFQYFFYNIVEDNLRYFQYFFNNIIEDNLRYFQYFFNNIVEDKASKHELNSKHKIIPWVYSVQQLVKKKLFF